MTHRYKPPPLTTKPRSVWFVAFLFCPAFRKQDHLSCTVASVFKHLDQQIIDLSAVLSFVKRHICAGQNFSSCQGSQDPRILGLLDPRIIRSQDCWILGLQDPRIVGSQDCRILGLQDPRIVGSQDCWILGLLDPRIDGSQDCQFLVLYDTEIFDPWISESLCY